MRYFIAKAEQGAGRTALLDIVLEKARVSFPSEDGWVVVNLARMEEILDEINVVADALVVDGEVVLPTDASPIVAGSLAEAIVTNNTVAAFEMISHRPMIALADAASDLDAVYRSRKGETVNVSTMLKTETIKLSDEQLKSTIEALTSALDGTYTDEESAVKMAIMKALKVVA